MLQHGTDTLEVVRVEVEGVTASFRYPHFLIGRQPTYPMPPPSTIYGMIAGAIGDYPAPAAVRFAYHFACERDRVDDLETIWFVEPNTSTRGPTRDHNLNAVSNVLPREWLIRPRMTLYLAGGKLDTLYDAFRVPRYLPVLGRSQDIVGYRSVDRVQLHKRRTGRFDESLLPQAVRDRLRFGPTIHMPRFVDPDNRTEVLWDWFVALDQATPVGPGEQFEPEEGEMFWADPDTRNPATGRERLLIFHAFTSDA